MSEFSVSLAKLAEEANLTIAYTPCELDKIQVTATEVYRPGILLAPVRAYAENETRNITPGKFPVICACQLHNDAGVIGAAALGSSI